MKKGKTTKVQSGRIPTFYPPPDKRHRPDVPLVGFKRMAKKWTGKLPDKFIAALVTRVSQTKLQDRVNDLSNFHTRHTKSVYISQVADWLKVQFQNLGYTDVKTHSFTKNGFQLENVVCTKQGTGSSGQIVIVCGHYDSIMQNSSDATARAPGADDNASGIAVILELARILASVQLENTVQFVAFPGEEQGFWGSDAYAAYVYANNLKVHRLINLDQVGYPPAGSTIIVERDMDNVVHTNDQESQDFGNVMAQMTTDYTSLPVKLGPIYGSDYMPFEARGYVVNGLYEGEGNPNYHRDTDTPGTVNFSYVAEVARITLASVLTETLAVAGESSSPVDLFIRDSPADTGDQPSPVPHCTSPDIWVRNNPPPADPNDPGDPNHGENPDDGHQPPINNVPNYLYVRVHNRGTQPAPANTFTVEVYHCNPSTAMIWPTDFTKMGMQPVQEVIPANGGSVRIGPFPWTPQIVVHECLLAIVSGNGDHAITDIFSGELEHSLLVRYDNNVGQHNVSPASSTPGGKTKTSFLICGTTYPTSNSLSIEASSLPDDTKILLRTGRTVTDRSAGISGFLLQDQNTQWSTLSLAGGTTGTITDFPLAIHEKKSVTLEIDFSYKAKNLKRYQIVASQEQDGHLAGQVTIEITAVKESEDYLYGNVRSRELHKFDCTFRRLMHPGNQVPFQTVKDALARGYNGCRFCLPEHSTD